MATAQFASMGNTPNLFKSELDPMDTFFDFNQGTTPRAPSRSSSSRAGPSRQTNNLYTVAPSPIEETEEGQVFAGPSHEYDRFQQQTGVTVGLANLNQSVSNLSDNQLFGAGFNSGIDEMGFNSGLDGSWSTGLDLDADMGADFGSSNGLPAMFYPNQLNSSNDLIDPSSLDNAEEPASNVGRLWPGMHQQQAQQAAMARAQSQQMQQRQMQQQQQLQQQQKGKARATSYQPDPHTEQSISRLLNQMRQGSMASSMNDDDSMQNGVLPHVARMRKEEEDMDEDERLLASEEGKKLSSKERRQLRNKVSARAFRSRRKEYIGQLEGEVAVKAQEANSLKTENQALHEENARYRGLIETLLRHPAFTPFVEDISKDPSILLTQPQQRPSVPAPAPVPAPQQQAMKQFDFGSQMQAPKQQEMQHVGMTMIPEAPVDLSMLNINHNNNNNMSRSRSASYNNYQRPQVFSVHNLPQGPSALDIAIDAVNQSRRQSQQFDNSRHSNCNTPFGMSDDFSLYPNGSMA